MAETAFGRREEPAIEEQTEGMCNTSYRLTYTDGFRAVLKVASPQKECFMTNECRLMDAEVQAMALVAQRTDIPVARVYRHDAHACPLGHVRREHLRAGWAYHGHH